MKLTYTELKGVFIAELPAYPDDRGTNMNLWTYSDLFKSLNGKGYPYVDIKEVNAVYSKTKGILRGIHYAPHRWKLYTCLKGKTFHVVVDLKSGKWIGVELSAKNHLMVIKHPDYGNSYQVLEDNTICLYLTNWEYKASEEQTYSWNDPKFDIHWPIKPPILSKKDSEAKWI